jgi:hypothetical protein
MVEAAGECLVQMLPGPTSMLQAEVCDVGSNCSLVCESLCSLSTRLLANRYQAVDNALFWAP